MMAGVPHLPSVPVQPTFVSFGSRIRNVPTIFEPALGPIQSSGTGWIDVGPGGITADTSYRLDVVFGNAGGRISWDDEQYRKDNVNVRIVGLGFTRFGKVRRGPGDA